MAVSWKSAAEQVRSCVGVAAECRSEVARTIGRSLLAAGLLAFASLGPPAGATVPPQASWLVDVPEGVPAIELPVVADSARTGRIDLVRELTIGDRSGDSSHLLYRPVGVEVDRRGRIFVLDAGMHHIQVYDEGGEHLMTIGSEGAGPGEFRGPSGMAISGERLIVTDARQSRVSIWSTDGEHIGDHLVDRAVGLGSYFGLREGGLLGSVPAIDAAERMFASQDTVGVFDERGTLLRTMATMPLVVPVALRRFGDGRASYVRADVPQISSEFVATEGGVGFAANTGEYQVFAFQHDRGMVWALRVALEREVLSDAIKEAAFKKIQERIEDARRSEIEFPNLKPALSHLAVDADGFLYVFPYAEVEIAGDRPVDVYGATGERLFTGWIPDIKWSEAHGDQVYAIELDADTDERTVSRYRLSRPW